MLMMCHKTICHILQCTLLPTPKKLKIIKYLNHYCRGAYEFSFSKFIVWHVNIAGSPIFICTMYYIIITTTFTSLLFMYS